MNKKILVTGGLGFIGSHTVVSLYESGFEPVIVDNLSNSEISTMHGIEKLIGYQPEWFNVDVNDTPALRDVFEKTQPLAVIHFAAYKAVGESVSEPLKYYRNNVGGLVSLLEVMKNHGCSDLVFSSSCTVYGEPDSIPVNEENRIKSAESPYGATKQMGEVILKDNQTWCTTQCLRYFNPIGAHPSGSIGELPLGIPNNLIPYLTQSVAGIRNALTVYGNDYDTPDGTCIRDYIHVVDLAEAHVSAVRRLLNKSTLEPFEVFNIGTGKGNSVLEVIQTFEKATGKTVPYQIGARRPGDVVKVWADTSRVNQVLGWSAQRTLEDMLRDAWNWQLQLQKKPI
jgi:UDP-glucose 4-epimerase